MSFYTFRSMAVAGGQRLQISLRAGRLMGVAGGGGTFRDELLRFSFDGWRKGGKV